MATLLQPFLSDLSPELAGQLRTYLELLLRWNSRMNLTAVRDPEQIVIRHFGESLFAARVLRDAGAFEPSNAAAATLADIGSGAGFPGVPIKLFAPAVHLTLIESQHKKATFLRELVRTLRLTEAEIYCGRAETWQQKVNVVTLRAVEKFERVLPVASRLVTQGGMCCLLLGEDQVSKARSLLEEGWRFGDSLPMPQSEVRMVVLAHRSAALNS